MSDKFPSQMQDKFTVRFPDGMRDKIAEIAKKNNRSMNAEIILALEKYIGSENRDILISHSNDQEINSSKLERTMLDILLKVNKIYDANVIKNMAKYAQTHANQIKNTSKKGAKNENNE